ncbi:MAG TPA: hypothetical protein VK483_09475 [Chitinophagaceae bacterium]|nr:hypothetical protein [Chitinophagaceae bacterium]
MKIPFIIYTRAIGLYALLTLPAIMIPVIYFISLFYVLFYGWFAWVLFSIIYLVVVQRSISYHVQLAVLYAGVVVSVLFAFQMLQVLRVEEKIWNSGPFLLFPAGAVFAGWISLFQLRIKIRDKFREPVFEFMTEKDHLSSNA